MQSIERLGDLGFISRKPHSNAGFMLRYTIAYHLVLWGLLWPSNHQSFIPNKWITLLPKNSLFFCNCHQPSKPSYMLEPKQKSFFFFQGFLCCLMEKWVHCAVVVVFTTSSSSMLGFQALQKIAIWSYIIWAKKW